MFEEIVALMRSNNMNKALMELNAFPHDINSLIHSEVKTNLLHEGVKHCNIESFEIITKTLLQKGIYINHKDAAGDTPLHYAVNLSKAGQVKILLNYGADCNILNYDGWSSLLMSVVNDDKPIYAMLIFHGAQSQLVQEIRGIHDIEKKAILSFATSKWGGEYCFHINQLFDSKNRLQQCEFILSLLTCASLKQEKSDCSLYANKIKQNKGETNKTISSNNDIINEVKSGSGSELDLLMAIEMVNEINHVFCFDILSFLV